MNDSKLQAFDRLLKIMDELREQCPWDRKQTLESLRHLTIEETYELADAILENNLDELKGEIGDIMLHMVFYAKIADEMGAFNIEDVLNFLCEKLIRRHPHIYSDTKVKDEEEVKANWEKIKLQEGKKSILSGVPKSLPALVKAFRIQEKTKQVGFEWENKEQVFEKVIEEMEELQVEVNAEIPNQEKLEEEFGDLMFSLINYARFLKVDPELALERTNRKFIKRFQYIEENAKKSLQDMTLEEMDALWNEAKKLNSYDN
jgi:XTP/dITP diphosphohydrolase